MHKLVLTALGTAAACFGIAAATGLGAAPKVVELQTGEIVSLKSDNFHCQVLNATQVACGANSLPSSVQVYFAPHQVAVLRFDKAGKKASIALQAKR
jgi:hypothetical protein